MSKDTIEPEVVDDIKISIQDVQQIIIDGLADAGIPADIAGLRPMENVTVTPHINVTVPDDPRMEDWLSRVETVAPAEYAPSYPLSKNKETAMLSELSIAIGKVLGDDINTAVELTSDIKSILSKYNLIR